MKLILRSLAAIGAGLLGTVLEAARQYLATQQADLADAGVVGLIVAVAAALAGVAVKKFGPEA